MGKGPVGDREYAARAKSARLTYLLMLRGSMTVDGAAREMECSRWNVYRVIDCISLAGVPITLDRGVISIQADPADWPY